MSVDPFGFPPDLRAFVQRCFDSVATLEILLLLRAERHRSWTAAEASREMRGNETHAKTQLARLRELGLLEISGPATNPQYEFRPASMTLENLVNELAVQYAAKRVSLISLIYEAKTPEPLRAFSDSFKLRKD